jgi:ferredoxin
MKVVVDREICEAQGVCVRNCPEVFRLDEDDRLVILMEAIPEDKLATVRYCVQRCPKQALSLVE